MMTFPMIRPVALALVWFGLCSAAISRLPAALAGTGLSEYAYETAYEQDSAPAQREALIEQAGRDARPMMAALALEARGFEDRAILIYRELIRLDRFTQQAHQGLARIYLRRRDYDRAIEHLEAASPIDEVFSSPVSPEPPRASRRSNR